MPSPGVARQAIRTVDFSQPTKFSSDQQRRISRALESFCQTATARLSAELRTPLEMEVSGSSQLAWLMAQRKLAGSSLSALLEVEPTSTRMLLVGDLSFVLMGVECLLGGSPTRPPEERRLSEIDWVLIRRLFDSIVAQLSAAWHDLGHLRLSVGDIEQQSEAIQIASVSEPTLMFRITTRFGASEGSLSLLIPWLAIESVADQLGGHDTRVAEDDVDSAVAIEGALSSANVTLRAEVTGATMSVEDVLALRPGSMVELGVPAENGRVGIHRGPSGRPRATRSTRWSPGGARGDEGRQSAAAAVSAPDDSHEALLAAVAEGAHRALYERCDDGVQTVEVTRLDDGVAPLQELEYPAVCVTADRADGVAGGVCLCTTAAGARALAIRSLDPLPPEASEEPLQDADLESAREWGAEVMASVSAAAAGELGGPLQLGEVSARGLAAPDAAPGRDRDAPVVLRAALSVHGEPCLLLVSLPAREGGAPAAAAGGPAASVADATADEPAPAPAAPAAAEPPTAAAVFPEASGQREPAGAAAEGVAADGLGEIDLSGALSATRVRVWAELGQVRLPLRRAIDLPIGGVVELDCDADAPVDLFVNGLRFAQGQLVITADGEWALRIDDVCADVAAAW